MATASQVRIETNSYLRSHGHAPRGRGSWAFEVNPSHIDMPALRASVARFNDSPPRIGIARLDETTYNSVVLVWLPVSTYSEAKRLAKLIIRHAGATTAWVAP